MWSLGCIIYELILYTLKVDKHFEYKDFQKVRYLLQGGSNPILLPTVSVQLAKLPIILNLGGVNSPGRTTRSGKLIRTE